MSTGIKIDYDLLSQKRLEYGPFTELVAAANPKIILEVGFLYGEGLNVWSQIASEQVFGIDMMGHSPQVATFNPGAIAIQGNSHKKEVQDQLKSLLDGRTIDVLFIDGDHSYEGVKRDFVDYSPLVSDDGLVAFHDILDTPDHRRMKCRVDQFWSEIKKEYEHTELIAGTPKWGGIGVLHFGGRKL